MEKDEFERYCFLAFGELALDVIYDEDGIIKEAGGVSAFNTIYNLSVFGEEVYGIGGVGTDINAIKTINSLKTSFVNTDNIQFVDKPTNVFYIYMPKGVLKDDDVQIERKSPVTGKSSVEWSNRLCTTLPKQFENRNIILVVSNFEQVTKDFIQEAKSKGKKCVVSLDITNPMIFERVSEDYMWEYLKQVNLLQCNQNTLKAVCEKLHVTTPQELFSKLNLEIFTVTKGHAGAEFFYRSGDEIKSVKKIPEKVAPIVDSTGAGDAFHAMLLMAYHRKIYNYEEIDKLYFDKAFKAANALSRKVVQIQGARGEQDELLRYMLKELTENQIENDIKDGRNE